MGEGEDGRRSSLHQEHGYREGTLAASSQDPLLRSGRRRHSRGDRRLEKEARSSQARSSRGEVERLWAMSSEQWASRPLLMAQRSLLIALMTTATENTTAQAPAKGVQV